MKRRPHDITPTLSELSTSQGYAVTAAERKVLKATLRTAIRGQARGLVLSVADDSALIRLVKFRDVDPNGAKLIAAWASACRP